MAACCDIKTANQKGGTAAANAKRARQNKSQRTPGAKVVKRSWRTVPKVQ